jgi:hypothetical protein
MGMRMGVMRRVMREADETLAQPGLGLGHGDEVRRGEARRETGPRNVDAVTEVGPGVTGA